MYVVVLLSYSRHLGSKDQSNNIDGDEERKPSSSRRLEHRASDRGEDYESDDDNDDDDDDDYDNDCNSDDDDDDENGVAEDGNSNQTTRKLNPLRI